MGALLRTSRREGATPPEPFYVPANAFRLQIARFDLDDLDM